MIIPSRISMWHRFCSGGDQLYRSADQILISAERGIWTSFEEVGVSSDGFFF
jgi:hypothetical protein